MHHVLICKGDVKMDLTIVYGYNTLGSYNILTHLLDESTCKEAPCMKVMGVQEEPGGTLLSLHSVIHMVE